MRRILIQPGTLSFPTPFAGLLAHPVYDSSCSPEARVYFIDTDGGLFLKRAPKGTLARQALMTDYFHHKGLSTPVIAFESLQEDWLLTRCVPGKDCTHSRYTGDPKRLCDVTAELLRRLHDTEAGDCPVRDRTGEYLQNARHNWLGKKYDASLFPDNWGYQTPEEAWQVVHTQGRYLRKDTLLHGDYCLPNILLEDWRFSGFIDLGAAGMGDRHVDLFWGIWSLWFNLKTDALRDRFLDAYGRQQVNEEQLRVVAAIEVFT